MKDPFDEITCCVTSYRRAWHLDRAIKSAKKAGFKKIAIATSDPTPEVLAAIEANRPGWGSYRVGRTRFDVGCNNTWMLAAYLSTTERIVVLHDDDVLLPAFGPKYREKIAPLLDAGVDVASWRANHVRDDGSTNVTEWFAGEEGVRPIAELERHVARMGTLCLSPIVSVLNRTKVIRACKEAEATLTHNDNLERPGMLLGTEILVYLRHTRGAKSWFFVNELLAMYGAHEGSGTIRHETGGTCAQIIRGYDRARVQGTMRLAPAPARKVIFVHNPVEREGDGEEGRRLGQARATWDFHFGNFEAIERPVFNAEVRTSAELGDPRPVPFIKDVIELGIEMALPEDVVCYANADIGLTTDGMARIVAGVERGNGIAIAPRRVLPNPRTWALYRTVRNCRADGGMDVVAFAPRTWESLRDAFPDFLLGREAWDLCLRTLAEEWADGPAMRSTITCNPEEWWRSRAYVDDVCWHEPHESFWKTDRATNPGGKHNRALARSFFGPRNNLMGLACVPEPDLGGAELPAEVRKAMLDRRATLSAIGAEADGTEAKRLTPA